MRNVGYTQPSALTPDGKFLVMKSPTGGGLDYIDPATGQVKRTAKLPSEAGSIQAFSADGKRGVSSGYQVILVVDLETGKPLSSVQRNVGMNDNGFSFSTDGKRLAIGGIGDDKKPATAVVWDVDKKKEIASVTPVHNQTANVALSPDGRVLATWGYFTDPKAKSPPEPENDPNRLVQFWDAATGKELSKVRTTFSYGFSALVFAPDGSLAAVAAATGQVYLYDPATGLPKGTLLGRSGVGRRLAYSPDGKTFAASGEDGFVQRWAMPQGTLAGGTEPPIPLAYSPQTIRFTDNERLVAWGTFGSLRVVWEVPSGKLVSPAGGNRNIVSGVAVEAGGKAILTAASDGVLIKWDPSTGKELGTMRLQNPSLGYGSPSFVNAPVRLAPNGQTALAQDGSGGQGVYDVATGLQRFVLPGDNNRQVSATLSPAGDRVIQVMTTYDPKKTPARVAAWDLPTARKLGSVDLPEMASVSGAISPDGKTLMTATRKYSEKGLGDFVVAGWDLATGKKLGEYTEEAAYGTTYITAADNTSAIVTTTKGKLLHIDVTTGKVTKAFETGGKAPIADPVLSPDTKLLAVAFQPGFGAGATATVLILDTETGKVKQTLEGPTTNPYLVSFSADGKQLFVSAADTTVLVYDLAK
jgi:WD40 repeat protein